ncbi:MAG: metal ABC transporter solute-binding protein, Zn/Mn family, partial [Acidobacteriota bacterium]
PREMVRLINLVRERGIKAIYFEQAVTDEVARVISRETGVKTLVLNPGANISQENLKAGMTFIDIMEQNLENLKNGLGCH